MASNSSAPLATRVSPEEAELIEEAVEEGGYSTSFVMERAVRYYIMKNPDNLPALQPDEDELGPLESLDLLPQDLVDRGTWRPLNR